MKNPIKNNRIVSDRTFAIRFLNFINDVQVNDCCSEEEQEYLLSVGKDLLIHQIATAENKEEIAYLKRIKRLIVPKYLTEKEWNKYTTIPTFMSEEEWEAYKKEGILLSKTIWK